MRGDSATDRPRVPPAVLCLWLAFVLTVPLLSAPEASLAVNAFDREIMEIVRDNRSDDLDHLMKTVSKEWNRENFILVALPVAAWGDETSFRAAEECFKAMILSEAVVSPLKYATNRRRPSGTHSRSNSSFPSSHAASSFAAASSIGHAYPNAKVPAYLIASLIAYSRVYNQRHYPTDVIAGACTGVLSARASRAYLPWLHLDRQELTRRLPFQVMVDSDGRGLLRLYISRNF